MKRFFLILAALLVIPLTGCDLAFSTVDNLIQPPKLSEEQNRIDAALRESVGDNISLVYPRTGDYKSAFIVENIDGEDTSEALVFYRENGGSGTVRMNILDQEDGGWVSVWDNTTVNGSEIEKISFLKRSGRVYIVMGVNATSTSDKTLLVYEYTDEGAGRILRQVFTTTCMNFSVFDLDDDGKEEIIVLSNTIVSETARESNAYLYSLQNGECTLLHQTPMDSEVTSYVNLFQGVLPSGKPALYLDVQKGTDQYGTEILTVEDGRLVNPIRERNMDRSTLRYAGLSCMEGDQLGVYRIPQTILLPGYSETAISEQPFLIAWYQYDEDSMSLVRQETTYTNYSLGYSLRIPERWLEDGRVTAVPDSANNEMTFFLYHGDLENESQTLLHLRVFSRSSLEREAQLPYGYTLLGTNGQMVYAYSLKRTHTDLDLTSEEVADLFTILQ